ncbi:MAG TPA: hypothetical protein VMO47_08355 [Rhodothermales bacterium]|nr:hypothetical protein [Rhodothermales bacterium]
MSDAPPARDAEPPDTSGEPFSGLSDLALRAYEEARISGLCHEGALEIALARMRDEDAGTRGARPQAQSLNQ